MNPHDTAKIANIVERQAGTPPINLRIEGGNILFTVLAYEDKVKKACHALMLAGLQHAPDDGQSEFHLSGTEGAKRVDVRWPYDATKPMWNES